ncbi:hypothetical protein PBY51_002303 [Eleginops maclovinus]|uniref:Schwannomin interacting protein 1 C-terminal domain-containing protein n=1 Tax=Eleginops maclovinus TaxID=56733 RepID=A0AAN7X855_ELEMC|nr:hypothetical protein PBY51_002303 [Eleginops maclovinus]
MEGEKETAEEKEEEEEEEEDLHHIAATASSIDHQELPIMHWEDLSQRIAELEQQEQERSQRSKRGVRPEDGEWRDVWEEDEEDFRKCRVAVVSSRFHHHKNLQLCFINNSDSEEEEDKKITKRKGCNGAGLKQEVVSALRTLRDELLAEQRECVSGSSSCGAERRKHLERQELQQRSVTQLSRDRATLQQEVHTLSSELVALLLVRDQLRTKQDAMLLDVQDLT